MPRGDRSGPSGEGPKTGRGMGYCTDNDHQGFMNSILGYNEEVKRYHQIEHFGPSLLCC